MSLQSLLYPSIFTGSHTSGVSANKQAGDWTFPHVDNQAALFFTISQIPSAGNSQEFIDFMFPPPLLLFSVMDDTVYNELQMEKPIQYPLIPPATRYFKSFAAYCASKTVFTYHHSILSSLCDF